MKDVDRVPVVAILLGKHTCRGAIVRMRNACRSVLCGCIKPKLLFLVVTLPSSSVLSPCASHPCLTLDLQE